MLQVNLKKIHPSLHRKESALDQGTDTEHVLGHVHDSEGDTAGVLGHVHNLSNGVEQNPNQDPTQLKNNRKFCPVENPTDGPGLGHIRVYVQNLDHGHHLCPEEDTGDVLVQDLDPDPGEETGEATGLDPDRGHGEELEDGIDPDQILKGPLGK